MDLEKLFKLLFNTPENICIEYSNIDGKESLKINGEDFTDTPKEEEEVYDDTSIKEYISKYKDNIKALDDCTFVEVIEEVEDIIDIQTLDSLLNQDSFTKDDAELIHGQIQIINTVIHEKLVNKIQDLQELLDRL